MKPTELIKLFEQWSGRSPETMEAIAVAGSARRYFRIRAGETRAIGTIGVDRQENRAFIYLSQQLRQAEVNVPEVYAVSNDEMAYLQEDLGSTPLLSLLGEKESALVADQIGQTMAQLAKAQYGCRATIDYDRCFPVAAMDRRSVMWDLNYFKYCFLKAVLPDISEPELEDDFGRFADILTEGEDDWKTLMIRDFQSRNVMIKDNHPWLIDFQGARRGPAEYDVVSFLWQARAGFTAEERGHYLDVYIGHARLYTDINAADFKKRIDLFALFRTLQVLGAYGFRGFFEHKSHFLTSINAAVANLRALLPSIPDSLTYLKRIATEIINSPRFIESADKESGGLTVTVNSFSYRKGIPTDISGNGGGYVFDCRAIHNPGRHDEYRNLTGLDQPVKAFLERDGEILEFVDHASALAIKSVKKYQKRGFTSLQINFGCTGGRHRSVYSAEAVGRRINEATGARVIINHIEQNITKTLPET